MIIDTIVVLYNPKETFLKNLENYLAFSNKVFLLDNSDKKDSASFALKDDSRFIYLSLQGNQGIAKALSIGIQKAMEDKADFALTMDQDSVFPTNRIEQIKNMLIKEENGRFGIIGLNFNHPFSPNEASLKEVNWWLTSGSFIRISAYSKLNPGIDTRFFIDAVDAFLGYQMFKAGYKTGYIEGISIQHSMGTPRKISIFFKTFYVLNYSPIRYYYIFRNNYYLFSLDKVFFKSDYRKIKYIWFFKALLFEKNKIRKLRAINLGKRDGRKGRLGKCPYQL